ncbi:MAG: hypothetical protein ACQEVT_03995 [Pseudomonadota bacterium]|uniref:hypothetical protein n=1 Tax=Roseovarius TaxID=74030 RepID=UPI0022A85A82|nr:hypothetical protein [Roseovarius sp. EGI FJ00037]MCZ0812770.1 hypothetical protein [Roseovarius sp. EGI FJ00037]
MQRHAPHLTHPREERRLARSARARSLARLVNVALFAAVLGAIWQERALAPPVHDQMQSMAVRVAGLMGGSETLQAYFPRGADGLSASADTGLADALTRKLSQ